MALSIRSLIPVLAGILAFSLALALLPQPIAARTSEPLAIAELAAPAEQAQVIAGGVLWRCEETTCRAPNPKERPLRACRELGRELGQVVRFETGGEALDADKLARCNA